MKRVVFVFTLLFLIFLNAEAKNKTLSPRAKIYLMTVGPYYNDFASVWGHVALLVQDPIKDIDIVYNYGGAAYGRNFMLKLITGKLQFYLDVGQTYKQELKTYERAKRDVDLYELNLDATEKNKIYNFLENNAKDENKFYRYEFYLKNCATFTYDAIKKGYNGELVYDDYNNKKTYRDIFDAKLSRFPWTNFFIRIVAGINNDRVLKLEEIFFVPRNMITSMKTGVVKYKNTEKPIFVNSKVVYDFPDRKFTYSFYKTPIFPILILFLIELLLFFIGWKRSGNIFRIYDKIWFVIASLLSIFIIFTMFFTHYVVTKWNLNILWANPLFIFTFFFGKHKNELILKILSVFLIFTILGSFFLPQHFYITHLLLASILLLKTLKYGFLKNKFSK